MWHGFVADLITDMTKNFGFLYEEPKPEDYTFGAGQIQAEVLQPDGQWDAYLPPIELQAALGYETYACASYGTLNCIEILLRRIFDFKDNFSDRYLAKISGTEFKLGNSPHTVAEFLRKQGTVDQYSWDVTPAVNSFKAFYATPPAILAVYAQQFLDHFDFKHDYVQSNPKSMMEALKYSPLGMSVYGWEQDDATGLYKAGEGRDNHWVCLYGYKENEYWSVFDTYDNSLKKVEWKHKPVTVKRYAITIAPKTMTLLEQLLEKLKQAVAWFQANPPAPLPVEAPKPPRLDIWARAIQAEESSKPPRPTDVNVRLRNPGNLKYTQYTASLGGKKSTVPGLDGGTFCEFETYEKGLAALKQFLRDALDNKLIAYRNTMSLKAFTKVYANPPNDGYAINVSQKLKVTIDTPIKDIV